jgi:coenzyme Q-binding protein COQ10
LRHHLTRNLPYAADQLFDLVANVEAYPKFVRWVESLRAWNRRPVGEGITTLDAEAKVRFGPVHERFSTRVRMDRPGLAIDVSLISGPFRQLENRWRFMSGDRGAELSFEIDFEFRSHLLDALLAANFHRAAETLVGCFETRAAELYGGEAWKAPAGC